MARREVLLDDVEPAELGLEAVAGDGALLGLDSLVVKTIPLSVNVEAGIP